MVSEMDDMRAYEAMFKGMRQNNPNPEAHTPQVKKVVQGGETKPATKEETV